MACYWAIGSARHIFELLWTCFMGIYGHPPPPQCQPPTNKALFKDYYHHRPIEALFPGKRVTAGCAMTPPLPPGNFRSILSLLYGPSRISPIPFFALPANIDTQSKPRVSHSKKAQLFLNSAWRWKACLQSWQWDLDDCDGFLGIFFAPNEKYFLYKFMIFHQPRFPSNNRIPLSIRYLLGWGVSL